MIVEEVGRGPVTLETEHFVAQGGEGSVYARDGVAYKLYHDPTRALPEGKLHALGVLDPTHIVRPERLLVKDGAVVGYAMRFVADGRPLAPLFTPAFRRRNGIETATIVRLVAAMRATVAHAHAHAALVVDLNELNTLVGADFAEPFFIDVDSWQVPGYPATALLDPVRDRHAATFCPGTDWFSWAVVTFQLWVGVHPYKGKHPTLGTLDARMLADASVFDPAVKVPAACPPVEVIPAPLRAWYQAVFQARHRDPPPPVGGASAWVPVTRPLSAGEHLRVAVMQTYDGQVRAFAARFGVRVAVTARSIWVDAHRVAPAPVGCLGLAFDPRGRPVVAALLDGQVTAWCEGPVRGAVAADALVGHAGHLHARIGDRVVELQIRGSALVSRTVARVLPRASALFPGVVVQHLLGAAWVTLLPAGRQVRVPALDGWRVLDACHTAGVLTVVGARGGRYARLTLRFDAAGHDLSLDPEVDRPQINLTVLDRGVVVRLEDDDALSLFPTARGATGARRVIDDALGADLELHTCDGGLVAVRGDTLLRLSLAG
mgnify:CR=1 FL=1